MHGEGMFCKGWGLLGECFNEELAIEREGKVFSQVVEDLVRLVCARPE